jgi:hypothetical protein
MEEEEEEASPGFYFLAIPVSRGPEYKNDDRRKGLQFNEDSGNLFGALKDFENLEDEATSDDPIGMGDIILGDNAKHSVKLTYGGRPKKFRGRMVVSLEGAGAADGLYQVWKYHSGETRPRQNPFPRQPVRGAENFLAQGLDLQPAITHWDEVNLATAIIREIESKAASLDPDLSLEDLPDAFPGFETSQPEGVRISGRVKFRWAVDLVRDRLLNHYDVHHDMTNRVLSLEQFRSLEVLHSDVCRQMQPALFGQAHASDFDIEGLSLTRYDRAVDASVLAELASGRAVVVDSEFQATVFQFYARQLVHLRIRLDQAVEKVAGLLRLSKDDARRSLLVTQMAYHELISLPNAGTPESLGALFARHQQLAEKYLLEAGFGEMIERQDEEREDEWTLYRRKQLRPYLHLDHWSFEGMQDLLDRQQGIGYATEKAAAEAHQYEKDMMHPYYRQLRVYQRQHPEVAQFSPPPTPIVVSTRPGPRKEQQQQQEERIRKTSSQTPKRGENMEAESRILLDKIGKLIAAAMPWTKPAAAVSTLADTPSKEKIALSPIGADATVKCAYCGADDAEGRCTGCKTAYCGRACQVADWTKAGGHQDKCKTK